QAFISACDKFIYLEILKSVQTEEENNTDKKPTKRVSKPKVSHPISKVDKTTIRLLRESVNDLADETGWTFLGLLGNYILKKKPDFDPRNYGFQKLLP